jgi:hypothetical protein
MRSWFRWFRTEWALTPIGWQFLLALLALFRVYVFLSAIIPAMQDQNARKITYVLTYDTLVTLITLVLPFVIATKARSKGRRFGLWLVLSLVFSPLVMGIAYMVANAKPLPSGPIEPGVSDEVVNIAE